MQDEYLTRCVVDPTSRKFFLYSSDGDERVVDCETVEQFMAVLEMVRDKCDEDTLAYASPLWPKLAFNSKKGGKKIPAKNCPITFFQVMYHPDLYKEILKCYDYETRNPSIYGNVIRSEMEFAKSSKQLQLDIKGDENNI